MPADLPEIPKQYDPRAAQEQWFPVWERRGYFNADPDPAKRPHTIMITSPSPTDGKTTTALAFSVAVASAGASVILIDTDVRRLPIRAGLEAVREPAPTLQSRSMRRTGQGELTLSLKPLLRRVVGHPNLQLLDAMDVGFDSVDSTAARIPFRKSVLPKEADSRRHRCSLTHYRTGCVYRK